MSTKTPRGAMFKGIARFLDAWREDPEITLGAGADIVMDELYQQGYEIVERESGHSSSSVIGDNK